jgi:hypothetical protein
MGWPAALELLAGSDTVALAALLTVKHSSAPLPSVEPL